MPYQEQNNIPEEKSQEVKKYINPYRRFVFAPLPNWLLRRKELSPSAKLVYARLCQFAGDSYECYPSQEILAKEIGLSERHVRRALNELEAVGLIERCKRGYAQSNLYRFPWHPWMDEDIQLMSSQSGQIVLPTRTNCPDNPVILFGKENQLKESKENNNMTVLRQSLSDFDKSDRSVPFQKSSPGENNSYFQDIGVSSACGRGGLLIPPSPEPSYLAQNQKTPPDEGSTLQNQSSSNTGQSRASEKNNGIDRTPYEKIKNLFNNVTKNFTKCRVLNEQRKRYIKARWREFPDLEVFEMVFKEADETPWVIKNNPDIMHVLRPLNFLRYYESAKEKWEERKAREERLRKIEEERRKIREEILKGRKT